MKQTRHMKLAIALCVLVVFSAVCALAACAGTPEDSEEPTGTVEPTATATGAIEEMYAKMAARAEEYAPEVITLADGVQVQRTPTEYDAGIYHQPGTTISYNTYYLNSDNRGCNSCHADLAETLNAMDYHHTDLSNSFGIQITVQMCMDCHNPASYDVYYVTEEYGFGSLIHGIHSGTSGAAFAEQGGNCMSCHNATEDGLGMQLWDEAKHGLYRGVVDVADVTGDFSFSQDVITPAEDLYNYSWLYYDNDYLRVENEAADAARSEADYAGWTITVGGAVEATTTYTLADLIAEAPSVTTIMTLQCTQNPTGGPYIGNCEITGIPLSWLLEKAGAASNATMIVATSSDGFVEPFAVSKADNAFLVYQIDGAMLSWAHGYPVQLWVGDSAAPAFVKEISSITVSTDPAENFYEWVGWQNRTGGYVNKPNVGIFETQEGQIINVGEAYTFEGYAHAFDEAVTAIEFSMDGGATWTTCKTDGAVASKWVAWKFAFTPDAAGAYVLQVRAVTSSGLVTEDPVEIMVNAK